MEFHTYPSGYLPSYPSISSFSFGNLVFKVREFFSSAVSVIIGNVFSAIFTFFFALGEYFLVLYEFIWFFFWWNCFFIFNHIIWCGFFINWYSFVLVLFNLINPLKVLWIFRAFSLGFCLDWENWCSWSSMALKRILFELGLHNLAYEQRFWGLISHFSPILHPLLP